MNKEKYIVIEEWMCKLGLTPNELLVFAIVYGFSQSERGAFMGRLEYIAKMINITKRSVIRIMNRLVEKELVIKEEGNLTASDKVAYSSTISTTATKATVYNASSSKHKVYGSIEYKSGDKYVEDAKVLVSKGDTDTIKSASKFSSNFKWRLELNPYGVATKNCTAEGTIKSR